MKKPQKIIIVISAMLIFLVTGCAAIPRQTGLNQPMPRPENATLLQEESRNNSQLDAMQDEQKETNHLLRQLITTLKTPTSPVQAQAGAVKTATAADFARKPESIEAKGPAAKVDNSESKRLKALELKVKELSDAATLHGVALLGESGKYTIFRIHSFAAGNSSLKHDDMEKQINNLILRVAENNLKYLRVVGYTNADGNKDNDELSGKRAIAVLEHITMYRPEDIKGIKPEKGGETKNFGIAEENRCVIVICEEKPKTP
ncbi:hypothetical protein L6307_01880 [Candidatus Parcubacteria bacterium]|nr:hypothetical protein [Patescibacteria group bacterium]MCG2697828.1 hypothetical protein [Candidatus Parcubacteria bacterium]